MSEPSEHEGQRETVLITGASSGIGRDLALLFAQEGSDLILVARREDRLRGIAHDLTAAFGVRARVIAMDLSDPGSPEALAEEVARLGARVDVLVNNAGVGVRGSFAELPAARQMAMLELNVATLTRLTRIFLPGMLERGRGGALNVASLAGFLPGPNMAVYYASKAYVLALSEALAEEVRGTGVTISCVAPGPTWTEFTDSADAEGIRLFRAGAMRSKSVARAAIRGFRGGRTVVLPGLHVKSAAFLLRFSPRLLSRRIAGWLNG